MSEGICTCHWENGALERNVDCVIHGDRRSAPASTPESVEYDSAELPISDDNKRFLREVIRPAWDRAHPKIVCLCGSTRFKAAFDQANYDETMAGRIVLSVGFAMHHPCPDCGAENQQHRKVFIKTGQSGGGEVDGYYRDCRLRDQLNTHGQGFGCSSEQKIRLDDLHKRKIDLADEILVLNVGGYVGDSTRSEILHAVKTGKPVRWLEPHKHYEGMNECWFCDARAATPSPSGTSPLSEGLWVVRYEDPDRDDDVFFGAGAEAAARKRFKIAQMNWTCRLLCEVILENPSAPAPQHYHRHPDDTYTVCDCRAPGKE